MESPHIIVEALSKAYPSSEGPPRVVLSGISLTIARGEFVSLFGPNGCGKTTLLRLLAGLDRPDSGLILIAGTPPGHARVGLVFQNYRESLFPWLRALDNIAWPMRMNGLTRQRAQAKVVELCSELELRFDLDAYPYQLSGGQQQLLALARALAYDPEVLLMDEPFSALDFETTHILQDTLMEIWRRTRKTIVFVSHDIDEAIYLADRLALLTRLPASVREWVTVPIDRPRSQAVRVLPEYVALKDRVIRTFYEEILGCARS